MAEGAPEFAFPPEPRRHLPDPRGGTRSAKFLPRPPHLPQLPGWELPIPHTPTWAFGARTQHSQLPGSPASAVTMATTHPDANAVHTGQNARCEDMRERRSGTIKILMINIAVFGRWCAGGGSLFCKFSVIRSIFVLQKQKKIKFKSKVCPLVAYLWSLNGRIFQKYEDAI